MKRSIDQKLRLRYFDARNESTETGEVVTNRRVSVVLKEDQENAINGKQKEVFLCLVKSPTEKGALCCEVSFTVCCVHEGYNWCRVLLVEHMK